MMKKSSSKGEVENNVSATPVKPRLHRVSIRLSEEHLAILDAWSGIRGPQGRAEVVEHLIRAEHEKRLGTFSSSKRSIFTTENKLQDGEICKVSLVESRSRMRPTKYLEIRSFYQRTQEDAGPVRSIILRRSLIPWLIETLQNAENAAQAEAQANRAKASAEKTKRSPEEVAREKELRQIYTEKYSLEKVRVAANLASRHKARAKRRELTQHFSTWEWLDLCDSHGFRCLICGEENNLEPHHRFDLALGGSNAIENIEPLCRDCHKHILPNSLALAEAWEDEQKQLLEKFAVGDRVSRRLTKNKVGTITELHAARRGNGPLSGFLFHNGHFVLMAESKKQWFEAQARVRWTEGSRASERIVELSELVKIGGLEKAKNEK